MMPALRQIACFARMKNVQNRQGYFRVADIVEPGLNAEPLRHYLRFCIASRTVENHDRETGPTGATTLRYRLLDEVPTIRLEPQADRRAVSEALIALLVRTKRDRDLLERQRQLWTALRALRQCRASELALAASTEAQAVSREQALRYLLFLEAIGYAINVGKGMFRLLPARASGTNPVLFLRNRAIDLNLMRAVNVTAQPGINHGGRAA